MTGIYLLDTNAVIALFARDSSIEKLAADATDVFLPVTAVAELFYGAEKSARAEANRKRIEEIVSQRKVLTCEVATARWFGRVKYELRVRGRPIPDQDIWIAALALQHNLTVITRDAHFKAVDNLPQESW